MRIKTKKANTIGKVEWELLQMVVRTNAELINSLITVVKAQVAAQVAAVPTPPATKPYDYDAAFRDAMGFLGLPLSATRGQIGDALKKKAEAAHAKQDSAALLACAFVAIVVVACMHQAPQRFAA